MLLAHCNTALATLALTLLSVGAACSACSDKVQSAPVDSAIADAAPDRRVTARDTGAEASDAAPLDWSWLQGEWEPLPPPYKDCAIRVAKNPETVGVTTTWKPCASGNNGCQEIVTDWSSIPGQKIQALGRNPIFVGTDGSTYLAQTRVYPKDIPPQYFPDRTLTVVSDMAGRVRFVEAKRLPTPSRCITGIGASSEGVTQAIFIEKESISRVRRYTWDGAISSADTKPPFQGAFGPHEGGGPTLFLREGGAVGRWLHIFLDTGNVTQTLSLQSMSGPRPVTTGFIGINLADGVPLVYIRHTGTYEVLVRAPGARNVVGYGADPTDNQRLVWVEADGFAPAVNPVMFTSPWATTAAGIVKKRLTTFEDPGGYGGGYMVVAHGHALLTTSLTHAILVRLTDGATFDIEADPGYCFTQPMWVDENEVWLEGGKRSFDGTGRNVDPLKSTFYRIRRDTLPPPSPAR
jgi:hypothetical protein